MKRHLWPLACCTLIAATPSMAQEAYPSYGYPSGYATEPSYDSSRDTRDFHFNPNDMFDRMANPMNDMFGSSRRRYDAYPDNRYAPPAYPPAYGYPGYPTYQQAPPGAGYAQPAPAYPGYADPYGNQPAAPAQPATPQAPAPGNAYGYDRPAPAPVQPQTPSAPGYGGNYNFRPLENSPSAETAAPSGSAVPAQPMQPQSPAHAEPPPAMATGHSGDTQPAVQVQSQMPDTVMHEGHALKFRPLDKPGYPPPPQQ